MKIKRSKQYRKLMHQYQLNFGFREPYQVLVDAEMLRDADRFKMDLVGGLERTLQGQVKPMITQCSMRHLYAAASEPGVSYLIDKAKTYERRRCGHLPSDYPEPLSTSSCLSSVVDPKDNSTNKHRYVVASQDMETRKKMREILGVPLVYINRSVMIMEPMADKSVDSREREERGKFRDGLRKGASGRESGEGGVKRKRVEGGEDEMEEEGKKKKRVARGPKGPNPLAVKKAKKKPEDEKSLAVSKLSDQKQPRQEVEEKALVEDGGEDESSSKKRRKRKHKSGAATGENDHAIVVTSGDAGESD